MNFNIKDTFHSVKWSAVKVLGKMSSKNFVHPMYVSVRSLLLVEQVLLHAAPAIVYALCVIWVTNWYQE